MPNKRQVLTPNAESKMQIHKSKSRSYTPVHISDDLSTVESYKGEDKKAIVYKNITGVNNFLKKQPQKIKGYHEREVIESIQVEGIPKGQRIRLAKE